MQYQHYFWPQKFANLPNGKIVCVGRNYHRHIQELNNPIPSNPILFIKPFSSLCDLQQPLSLPDYADECQHEIELTVLIKYSLKKALPEEVLPAIAGYGIGLDLTLRKLQQQLKEQGHPWELAKAFDKSAPLSPFIPTADFPNPQDIDISLEVNGAVRQSSNTSMMIWKIFNLISYISNFFTLFPGDVIMTGTPAGVEPLSSGDQILCSLNQQYQFKTFVK